MLPERLVVSVDVNPELVVESRSYNIIQVCMVRTHGLHKAQSIAGTLTSEKRRDIGIVPRRVAFLLESTIAAIKDIKKTGTTMESH